MVLLPWGQPWPQHGPSPRLQHFLRFSQRLQRIEQRAAPGFLSAVDEVAAHHVAERTQLRQQRPGNVPKIDSS